jgi:hypothetical protein
MNITFPTQMHSENSTRAASMTVMDGISIIQETSCPKVQGGGLNSERMTKIRRWNQSWLKTRDGYRGGKQTMNGEHRDGTNFSSPESSNMGKMFLTVEEVAQRLGVSLDSSQYVL